MVFMSSSVLDWHPILQAWLKSRSEAEAAVRLLIYVYCRNFSETGHLFKADVRGNVSDIVHCIVCVTSSLPHAKR